MNTESGCDIAKSWGPKVLLLAFIDHPLRLFDKRLLRSILNGLAVKLIHFYGKFGNLPAEVKKITGKKA